MSETSNGMPDLSAGDSEPSMEDILASIRKIIADDNAEPTGLETDSEELVLDQGDTVAEATSFSETVDDEQFEIPDVEGTSQTVEELTSIDIDEPALDAVDTDETAVEFEDEDVLELINFAEEDSTPEQIAEPIEDAVPDFEPATGNIETVESSFDESLDLVMDSDASDYYAQSAESDENRLLREEIENDLNLDTDSLTTSMSTDLADDLVSSTEELPTAPDLDDLLDDRSADSQNILALNDEQAEELFSNLADAEPEADVAAPELVADDVADTDDLLSDIMDMDTDDTEPMMASEIEAAPSEDQDMDLVKSLLADLMDEPDTSELEDEFLDVTEDDDASERENILDEILYQSMDDEAAIAEADSDDAMPEESELAQIARTAREAAATPYAEASDTRSEDQVELPKRDVSKKLNLAAAGGFVGVAAGAALGHASSKDVPGDIDAHVSKMVEEELDIEDLEELLDMSETDGSEAFETAEIETDADDEAPVELVEELETPQENEDMGRAAKKEALLDEDIEQESSEAFAALSHVVQEKAELEENGPAIGDLVQDALRPMLKEWLDKNLKGIVERAVTKEVKRISSGK